MAQTTHNATDQNPSAPDQATPDVARPELPDMARPELVDPNSSISCAPGTLKIADLATCQGLTDRYDEVLLKLCDTSSHPLAEQLSTQLEDGATRFCHHIKHALNADTAYLCNRASLSVVTTSSSSSARETCEDTRTMHSALTTMVSDLWNCEAPLCPPDIKVYPDEPGFSYLVIPLATQHDHLLIITNADTDKSLLGDYLADALTAVYESFLKHTGAAPGTSICETTVFDKLHCKYQLSSKVITRKRFELYRQQLNSHAVEFEGLSLASKTTKASALQTKLPDSLYAIAKLWNEKFKVTLDCYALIESAHGYKTLCDNESLLKFSDSRTLKVRVHAESLSDLNYSATLQDLTEKSVIHASRVQFTVIPLTGQKHDVALQNLQDRFGISHSIQNKSTKAAHSFADEFDMMQVNGVKKKTTSRQS